jgi:hypothetical protein
MLTCLLVLLHRAKKPCTMSSLTPTPPSGRRYVCFCSKRLHHLSNGPLSVFGAISTIPILHRLPFWCDLTARLVGVQPRHSPLHRQCHVASSSVWPMHPKRSCLPNFKRILGRMSPSGPLSTALLSSSRYPSKAMTLHCIHSKAPAAATALICGKDSAAGMMLPPGLGVLSQPLMQTLLFPTILQYVLGWFTCYTLALRVLNRC